MSREDILEKIIEICADIFDDDSIELTEESSAEEIEAWDSLAQLNIVSDIEDEFDISLSIEVVSKAKTIGELVDIVAGKI